MALACDSSLASMLNPSFFKILKTSLMIHQQVYHSMQSNAVCKSTTFLVVSNLQ